MKSYFVFLFFLVACMAAFGQDRFTGNWQNENKDAIIRIYELDGAYYATVVSSKDAEILEKTVLVQMQPKSETKLFGGTYYDPELQSEYEAKLKLTDNDTIRMTILSGIFSKTIVWHRVELACGEKTNEYIVVQH